MGSDALDVATDFEHPGGEPAGNVEPIEEVGGVPEMLADTGPVQHRPSETTTLTVSSSGVPERAGR